MPLARDDVYDTLDDIGQSLDTVEALCSTLSSATRGAVGVCMVGNNALCNPDDSYWGRVILMGDTGEYLQVRICPRGSATRVVKRGESRMIATRRTSTNAVPVVSVVLLFQPRPCDFANASFHARGATTVGCRGVHLLLPSLFSKHYSTRDPSAGYASIDPEGFHSVRPSAICVRSEPRRQGDDVQNVTSCGYAYLTMAAHLFGVDLPDHLARSAEVVTDSEHNRRLFLKQRSIVKAVGESNTRVAIASSLAISDVLGVEGVCSFLCNNLFEGALPDGMHAPYGLPLLIMMSIHVACHPERFNLQSGTPQDAFVNREIMCQFHSRWAKMAEHGYRAVDLAIKSGYDNAVLNAADNEEALQHLDDNLKFWQRVGQRTATKFIGDALDAAPATHFGAADLVDDPVSATKYSCLHREGFARPAKESPIDKLLPSSTQDIRATLARVMDTVELWLRAGTYVNLRVSQPNANRVRPPSKPCDQCAAHCDCITDEPASDDNDDLLHNRVCVAAVENASGTITTAMLHGAYVVHQMNIRTYLVSDHITNKCADCGESVSVLQGTMFSSSAGQCMHCNRKRCYRCSTAAARSDSHGKHCLRCMPAKTAPQRPPAA